MLRCWWKGGSLVSFHLAFLSFGILLISDFGEFLLFLHLATTSGQALNHGWHSAFDWNAVLIKEDSSQQLHQVTQVSQEKILCLAVFPNLFSMLEAGKEIMNRCCEILIEVAWRTEVQECMQSGRREGQQESVTFPELSLYSRHHGRCFARVILFNGPLNYKVHTRRTLATLPTV